jgi:hypothetical protein
MSACTCRSRALPADQAHEWFWTCLSSYLGTGPHGTIWSSWHYMVLMALYGPHGTIWSSWHYMVLMALCLAGPACTCRSRARSPSRSRSSPPLVATRPVSEWVQYRLTQCCHCDHHHVRRAMLQRAPRVCSRHPLDHGCMCATRSSHIHSYHHTTPATLIRFHMAGEPQTSP